MPYNLEKLTTHFSYPYCDFDKSYLTNFKILNVSCDSNNIVTNSYTFGKDFLPLNLKELNIHDLNNLKKLEKEMCNFRSLILQPALYNPNHPILYYIINIKYLIQN